MLNPRYREQKQQEGKDRVITIAAVNAKKKQEEKRKSPNLSAELALRYYLGWMDQYVGTMRMNKCKNDG